MLPSTPSWKGRHFMNIFLSENGSLFTAVAIVCSISITWNFSLAETTENMSNMSWVDMDRGTLILSKGKLLFIVPVVRVINYLLDWFFSLIPPIWLSRPRSSSTRELSPFVSVCKRVCSICQKYSNQYLWRNSIVVQRFTYVDCVAWILVVQYLACIVGWGNIRAWSLAECSLLFLLFSAILKVLEFGRWVLQYRGSIKIVVFKFQLDFLSLTEGVLVVGYGRELMILVYIITCLTLIAQA